jgi:ketosteroid isomerase-like protein
MRINEKGGLHMSDKDMEKRIGILEDIEEIKKLKAKYCYFLDTFQTDALVALFSEDATADFRPLVPEKLVGKKAIEKFYKGDYRKAVSMAIHQVMNPIVEVDGNHARGTWYMFGVVTFVTPKGEVATWEQVRYEDEFVKEDGKWRISFVSDKMSFMTPYEDGWVKTPMIKIW